MKPNGAFGNPIGAYLERGVMKASERCTEKYQGDRCRFRAGHLEADNSNDPMQTFHVGAFTVWDAAGNVQAKAQGAEASHKRNRHANRNSRMLTSKHCNLRGPNVIAALTQLEKFYGGVKNAA